MKKIILLILITGIFQFAKSQDDSTSTRQRQLFVTGYLAFNGEYVNNLPVFDELKPTFGTNIAEASILSTLKPCKRVTVRSVITYKPRLLWDGIITELSGEFRTSEALGIKAGRFILPVNPANAEYYAPMNTGIALPTFVTNHSLFPLNMNGIDINGKMSFSDNFKAEYNLMGGQYSKIARSEEGILGFFGREGVYMTDSLEEAQTMIAKLDAAETGIYPQHFGTAARLGFEIVSFINFGFGGFYGKEEATLKVNPTTTYTTDIDFSSFGADLALNFNNLNIKSTYWINNEIPADTANFETYNVSILTGEISYTLFGKITPYAKIDVIKGRQKDWLRTVGGINFRPVYEIALKIEYLQYMQEYIDNFGVFQFSVIFSF